jgi:hypothetical protein
VCVYYCSTYYKACVWLLQKINQILLSRVLQPRRCRIVMVYDFVVSVKHYPCPYFLRDLEGSHVAHIICTCISCNMYVYIHAHSLCRTASSSAAQFCPRTPSIAAGQNRRRAKSPPGKQLFFSFVPTAFVPIAEGGFADYAPANIPGIYIY